MSDPPTLLVRVEEAFTARGRGVLLRPRISVDEPSRQPFPVRLVLPNGETRETTAVLEVSHVSGSLPPFAMVRLSSLGPEDVPAGTEVHRL